MAYEEELTEYERKRLENIRRNEEMMASLKLHTIAAQVSAATKRPRVETKKSKIQNPTIAVRRSLRSKGLPPDAMGGLEDDDDDDAIECNEETRALWAKCSFPLKESPSTLGPISMRDPYLGTSNRALIDAILGIAKKSQLTTNKEENEVGYSSVKLEEGICGGGKEGNGALKLESLTLKPENKARVVQGGSTTHLSFFPCTSLRMVVAGNKVGNVGFWNMDCKEEGKSGIYVYHPHSGPITGISIQQHCMSKVFTSSYYGMIRLMDAEKEVFDLVYSSEDDIYSIAQQSRDPKCLYFSEGKGGLNIWDERIRVCSNQWTLHEKRINSIHFNSENSNLMATSSSDRTACIWDLRSINADKLKPVTTVWHKRAVNSAHFSPSGRSLVTTSLDDMVGISSGVNFGSTSMIFHENKTNFRAIWGWDDAYVFIGNKKRAGIDVISPVEGRTVFTLESRQMYSMPCTFAIHPYNVGMLGGGSGSGGLVYVWTLPSLQSDTTLMM